MSETATDAVEHIIRECGQPDVHDYAIVGNCKTLGLIAGNGSLDWLCAPHFSAPSMFAALVDAERGGRFVTRLRGGHCQSRRYLDDTCVLCTEQVTDGGRVRMFDLMTMPGAGDLQPEHLLLRLVHCVQGEVDLEVLFQPRPDYARATPRLRRRGALGWQLQHGALVAYLEGDLALEPLANTATLYGRRRLRAGDRCSITLGIDHEEPSVLTAPATADELLEATCRWWRDYSRQCSYQGPYRNEVLRSRLTLKLLDSSLTGAMIAAGTTSLPESFDGDRNWDYRYCWLRDAGQVIQSFTDLNYSEEALSFLEWMLHATRLTRPHLQPVYDIFGESKLPETQLGHLRGHQGHGPVRIGNAAREQLQLDVYGDVIIAACDYLSAGGKLDRHDRHLLRGFGDVVQRCWHEPDHGIWEVRKPRRHNTHSKLMCWAALDSLLRIDSKQPMDIDRGALRTHREAIRADIDRSAFDAKRGCYVAQYEGAAADATLLLISRLGFLSADDPRVEATRRFVEEQLDRDGLVYRYPPGGDYDGQEGCEHPFGICSYWMVECLARQGRFDQATERFERLLGLANDVGLYAEQFHRDTGKAVGNFPQAFTHVGLITAALELARGNRVGTRQERHQ